jgi:Xaa-Pro aminopeptidase
LTGFSGSAGVVLITADACILVVDGRYGIQAPHELAMSRSTAEVAMAASSFTPVVVERLGHLARVGVEAEYLPWSEAMGWVEAFEASEIVATRGLVERVRSVKAKAEVERIQAAAAIADAALAEVRPLLSEEPTEVDFARRLDAEMLARGASAPSFETIVASGPNSALPHSRPTGRRIREGDVVVVDFGAVVDGYCSDMTRTFSIGAPSSEVARQYELVALAQSAGVAAVRPGVSAKSVDTACRAVIEKAGYGEQFVHATGHGVGLDIHEAPRVASTSDATLAVGQVLTVEPGVYVEGSAGVRIEDTLVVTERGGEPLTLTPKEFALPARRSGIV